MDDLTGLLEFATPKQRQILEARIALALWLLMLIVAAWFLCGE